jgi:hypothetical protein
MSMLSEAVDGLESANDELQPAVSSAVEALNDIPVQTDRITTVTGAVSQAAADLNAALNGPAPTAARRRR